MSRYHFYNESPAAHVDPAREGSAIRRFFQRMLARLQRGRTLSALSALDDATLRDIGISRSEIPHVADQVAGMRRGAAPSRAAPGTAPARRAPRSAGSRATASHLRVRDHEPRHSEEQERAA